MKILIRNVIFFTLTAIALSTVTCADTVPENSIVEMSAYFETLNVTGEQVWMPNYNTGKVSQMLLKFLGDRNVDVIVELIGYNGENPFSYIDKVGSGKIEKGILEFSIDKNMDNDDYLLNSNNLLYYYFNEWYKTGNNIVMEPEVKGNIITLITLYNDPDTRNYPSEAVIREGFSGTSSSLTGEYIYYIYVNADCTISAGKTEITELQYTFNEFELSLKHGWNTICKSETYTTTGDSSYSMTVKNPAIKWVMQKIK